VVSFVPRDAKHRAAGGVDHRRVEWVFPGGAAEPGVVSLLSGAGHEADAISRLVPPGPGCGFERPGLGQRQVAPALRVPGQLRLGRQPPGPCLCDPAWHRENAAVALGR